MSGVEHRFFLAMTDPRAMSVFSNGGNADINSSGFMKGFVIMRVCGFSV